MKKTLSKFSRWIAFALILLSVCIIHSCKKDIFSSNASIDQQEQKAIVQEAKSWFENVYPKAANNAPLKVASLGSKKTWYVD
jgi:hypothetical protein